MNQPFLPLFFGDLLAATPTWDGQERALYILLLAYAWSAGPLPKDPRRLAKMCQYSERVFNALWETVGAKFVETDAGLINARLEQHRKHASEISKKRALAGANGAAKRHGKTEAIANETPSNDLANAKDLLCHPNQTNPNEEPPTPKTRKPKSALTPFPEDFFLSPDLANYAAAKLPDANVPELFEGFKGKALAKGWKYASWERAWQEYVRNCRSDSGHFAAGQYPKSMEKSQWY